MPRAQTSQHTEIEAHYELPYYWLFMVQAYFLFVVALAFSCGFVAITYSQAGLLATIASVLVSLLVVATAAYFLWIQDWKWRHWYLEIDADEGAAYLHREGSGTYFPYVSDKGVQYMPLQGAQMTKNQQKWYEQLIFKRSSTISLDGDAQDDMDFKNLRFVKDAWRIKNILVAYNQRQRTLESEQSNHLANIALSNARIVEQNDVAIEQNNRIIELLESMVSAPTASRRDIVEIHTLPEEDSQDASDEPHGEVHDE